MPTAGRPESGFLALADISGFTAFVTATELEHGAEVTGALLAGGMEGLSPPMEIQELEGDAGFALGPDHGQGAGRDRESVVEGEGGDLGGRRIIKKKTT